MRRLGCCHALCGVVMRWPLGPTDVLGDVLYVKGAVEGAGEW